MRYAKATAVLAILLCANAILAETVVQTVSLPRAQTNWIATAEFEQVDPTIHALASVHIAVDVWVDGKLYHENTSAEPTNWSDIVTWSMRVRVPWTAGGVTVLNQNGAWTGYGPLEAFDGSVDFEGGSGETALFAAPTGHAGGVISEDYHDAFYGDETVVLDVLGRSYSNMTLNGAAGEMESEIWSSATVTVTYELVPWAVNNEDKSWGEVKNLFR